MFVSTNSFQIHVNYVQWRHIKKLNIRDSVSTSAPLCEDGYDRSKLWKITSFFCFKNCLILIISPDFLKSKKCASYLCKEINKLKIQFFREKNMGVKIHPWWDKAFKNTILNLCIEAVTWNYALSKVGRTWTKHVYSTLHST